MKILNWNKFFESKSIHFEESDEFKSVRDKHRISDSLIKDFFTDLIDEGFDLSTSVGMKSINKIEDVELSVDGIRISYYVKISKRIENPNKLGRSQIDLHKYSNFLELQTNYIKTFDLCCERISQSEDLSIAEKKIILIPFWGAGNSTKESDDFSLTAHFYSYVSTNDLIEARKKFEKTDSPIKKAYDKIVDILKKRGVSEAERLIDTQDVEEQGFVMFGFLTNDEIIVLADFHYEEPQTSGDGLVIHYEEVDRAIKDYKDGYCSDYL
jgi:hypothetical protein